MLAEQREMNKNIPLRLKIVAGVWELLIVLSLLFSIVALSMAAHNSGTVTAAATIESVKSNVDEYLAQDASHAVITFSSDPRERAYQLWNLHNLHTVMERPPPAVVPSKTPEVPDDVNEVNQNSSASVVS
jgi:hypothetical protein